MKKPSSQRNLDSYIESIEARQQNLTPSDLLRNGRSVDEVFFKGVRNAPLVQRVGLVIAALAYFFIAATFVSMAADSGKWFEGAFGAVIFGLGAWFIRNALRK